MAANPRSPEPGPQKRAGLGPFWVYPAVGFIIIAVGCIIGSEISLRIHAARRLSPLGAVLVATYALVLAIHRAFAFRAERRRVKGENRQSAQPSWLAWWARALLWIGIEVSLVVVFIAAVKELRPIEIGKIEVTPLELVGFALVAAFFMWRRFDDPGA